MARNIRKKRVYTKKTIVETKELNLIEKNEAFNLFIQSKIAEGLRPRTIDDYQKTWGYVNDWLDENGFNITYVHEYETDMFRAYIKYITEEKKRYEGHTYLNPDNAQYGIGLKPATVNGRIRGLKSAFNWFLQEGYVIKNPMNNVKLQKDDIDKLPSFNKSQIKRLLSVCDQRSYVGFRDYVFQILLLDSGMRINEALSLRKQDLDVKTRIIELDAKLNKNRRARTIPLSNETIKLLSELILENNIHFPQMDYIFLSVYGNHLRDTQANKRLKHCGVLSGVDQEVKVSAHVYRHTFATNYILNGGDPYTLMRILGHSNISMVRRYIQMNNKDIKEAHAKYSPIKMLKGVKRKHN